MILDLAKRFDEIVIFSEHDPRLSQIDVILDVDKISPMVGISIYSFVTDLLLITNELRVGMI